jgi:hypothetical protein
MGHGRVDGNFPFNLLGRAIADRFAGLYRFRLWNSSPGKEQALKQGGLAGASVPGDGDVSDIVTGKTHGNSFCDKVDYSMMKEESGNVNNVT